VQEDFLTAWRRSCEAKSITELQEALDRNILNREKAAIVRTVIGEKREQQCQQGEIADLKRENADLTGQAD
jgi:hypothetical protein